MTKQRVYVLVWLTGNGPIVDVEVFDSMTLLTSFRLQKRIQNGYEIHNRTVWAGREEDKVVPVLNEGRHADGSRDYGWPT